MLESCVRTVLRSAAPSRWSLPEAGSVRGAIAWLIAGIGLFGAAPAIASAAPTGSPGRGVVLAFLSGEPLAPAPAAQPSRSPDDAVLSELAQLPSVSIGLLSATQGRFITAQALLDITQGTRVSGSTYSPQYPPALDLQGSGQPTIKGWSAALERAASAPQTIEPGLLAQSIPHGAGYVGVVRQPTFEAVAAADRHGRVAAVSVGSGGSIVDRVAQMRRGHALVVVDLPVGPTGRQALAALARGRGGSDLLIVVQRPPDRGGHELLWLGIAGLGGARELSSPTTNLPGFSAAIDLAPTILKQLGLGVPSAMRGQPIHASGRLDTGALRAFRNRLAVINDRRIPVIKDLLLAWALLMLLAGTVAGAHRTRRRALRIGALAMLWTPVAVLVAADIQPSRTGEKAVILAVCFVLGAATDRLVAWPRGPLVPGAAGIAAITLDALMGTHLLVRSLLGPNPSFGARFYGIGNELKSGLAVLMLAAVAAALTPASRSRRTAAIFAASGAALGVIVGAGRLGAGVGGVILVAAGAAVATVMMLPGGLTRRRLVIAVLSPLGALVALAAIDLATSGGTGHYAHNVLGEPSASNFKDIFVRRYGLAFDALRSHDMPAATATALIAVGFGLRNRWLLDPLPDPPWRAALVGGLVAGVTGALSEDSGPLLLIVAVFALACLIAYIRGAPELAVADQSPTR